jgi:hypothetical protein
MASREPAPDEIRPGNWGAVVVAWIMVGVPLAWGVFQTLKKAALLFQ